MAAHAGLRCAVRARLADGTGGVALREVLVHSEEWRSVERLGLLASNLWFVVGCGGDALPVYCEFSRRCSCSLS